MLTFLHPPQRHKKENLELLQIIVVQNSSQPFTAPVSLLKNFLSHGKFLPDLRKKQEKGAICEASLFCTMIGPWAGHAVFLGLLHNCQQLAGSMRASSFLEDYTL